VYTGNAHFTDLVNAQSCCAPLVYVQGRIYQ